MLCLLTGIGIFNLRFVSTSTHRNLAMKSLEVYYIFHDLQDISNQSYGGNPALWVILYISCDLATTILSTLLIIYRIITVSHRGMGVQSFRGIIEIIVESALIYSIALLVYIINIACNSDGGLYIDILASYARVCFIHLLLCTLVWMLTSL